MPTGYEVHMYRDITRIADALEAIAKSLTLANNKTQGDQDG